MIWSYDSEACVSVIPVVFSLAVEDSFDLSTIVALEAGVALSKGSTEVSSTFSVVPGLMEKLPAWVIEGSKSVGTVDASVTKGSIGTHLGGIDRGGIPIRCRGGKGGRGCKPKEKKGKKKAVSCCLKWCLCSKHQLKWCLCSTDSADSFQAWYLSDFRIEESE